MLRAGLLPLDSQSDSWLRIVPEGAATSDSGTVQAPRTSNPNDRAADASAVLCVATAGSGPIRSRQIRAVARCTASSVPRGIGIGSLARLRTEGRSSTRSMASSHSVTMLSLAAPRRW